MNHSKYNWKKKTLSWYPMRLNLHSCGGLFDFDKKQTRLLEIEKLESSQEFWNNVSQASQIQREKSIIQSLSRDYTHLQEEYDTFEILQEYAFEDNDSNMALEAIAICEKFLKHFNRMEQKLLLSGEVDPNNAIIQINAGAGGTESCDWAAMLLRMITKWSESKGFSVILFDERPGDSAGIKSSTVKVEGEYAYGLLKSETGVHRLVRISPFDSGARRHTSFASLFVSPEIDDTINIDIADKDLKIDVFRSGGAGGQSVNTTDSAVRITHLPTNIIVTCQNERSQHQNKAQAMKVLRSRLFDREMEKKRSHAKQMEEEKKDNEWGGQIRSYVLHPYKLVKDHRTTVESSQAQKVLDGDLDKFIDAFLRWDLGEKE